ncbi:MAG: cytochrome-c peroxidase [Vicinamibacterales bacterium]
MRSVWLSTATLAVAVVVHTAAYDLRQEALDTFSILPAAAPAIEGNPTNPSKVELGRMLFFEPRLSKSGLISCSTCHAPGRAGADNVKVSAGHGGQRGTRNAPTVFNAVFSKAQFWDGRAADLRAQAKGPIQTAVEMNNTPERVIATLESIPDYVTAFEQAFPGVPDAVTFDNVAAAIEVFEATLLTPNSPFDRFLAGDDTALDAAQRAGLETFMVHGCARCHKGVNLGGEGYYVFGTEKKPPANVLPAGDKGRYEVTKKADDTYAFRTSPLRNVALTAPYFHSGEIWDLDEAVAMMVRSQLDSKLSDQQIREIGAFLRSLTGDQPRVALPILPPSTATTPKPEM